MMIWYLFIHCKIDPYLNIFVVPVLQLLQNFKFGNCLKPNNFVSKNQSSIELLKCVSCAALEALVNKY